MSPLARVQSTVFLVKTLAGAGLLAPSRPDRLVSPVPIKICFGRQASDEDSLIVLSSRADIIYVYCYYYLWLRHRAGTMP